MMKDLYKYELHCHTCAVSKCGRVSPEEVVKMYKEAGYDGIVITEHYSPMTWFGRAVCAPQKKIDLYFESYDRAKKCAGEDFTVLLGMEFRHYACVNDYLVYGLTKEWLIKQKNLLAMSERRVYQMFHKAGFLVLQAHPYRPLIYRHNPDFIDGVEVFNGKTEKKLNDKAKAWSREKVRKIEVSGSDFHKPENLAMGGIITKEPIKSNEDLLRILKSGDYELIENYKT